MFITGHCVDEMKKMDGQSIDMVIYSPPYWHLRFYNTAFQFWGGSASCIHEWNEYVEKALKEMVASGKIPKFKTCKKCGAWYGELGWEQTPEEYVDHLLIVNRQVFRVLKDNGTCWINIGDNYDDNSLQLIPEQLAIQMKKLGWYVRNNIVWGKEKVFGNPVLNRFLQDWEPVFFFTKISTGYYFDIDANRLTRKMTIAQVQKMALHQNKGQRYNGDSVAPGTILSGSRPIGTAYGGITEIKGANQRCVWQIAAAKTEEGHYAPFPPELVRRCILAGCPAGGTVLDPFSGTGTTVMVAENLGRKGIGIELNPNYVKHSILKTGGKVNLRTLLK